MHSLISNQCYKLIFLTHSSLQEGAIKKEVDSLGKYFHSPPCNGYTVLPHKADWKMHNLSNFKRKNKSATSNLWTVFQCTPDTRQPTSFSSGYVHYWHPFLIYFSHLPNSNKYDYGNTRLPWLISAEQRVQRCWDTAHLSCLPVVCCCRHTTLQTLTVWEAMRIHAALFSCLTIP